MPPKHKPWWKVDADTDESDKLARLSSDSARWGWFRMGCKAKTQRRMGVFAGRTHMRSLTGTSLKHIAELVASGLAHDWPTTCQRCTQDYAGDAQPGDLIVHDYRREQRDPTAADRQAEYRNSHAERNGVSNGSVTPSSRALSPSLSPSPSTPGEEEPYQVATPPEAAPLQALAEELTQRSSVMANVWGGLGEQAVLLARKHGVPAVEQQWRRIAAEERGMPTLRQLVFGADDALNRVTRSSPETAAERDDRELAELKALAARNLAAQGAPR